jgi:hypothetical protein
MSNGRVVGIEVRPHDEGSFLIQSRTDREDYWMVEFVSEWVKNEETGEFEKRYTGEITCTCPSYQFRKECFHIRYICKLLGVKTPQANNHNQLEKAA